MVSMTSFEVLPFPSVSEIQETSQSPDFIFIQDIAIPVVENSVNSVASSDSDAAREEMCQRMKTLVDENNALKEKLIRNNKIMHEQLNIISSWHDQIAASNSKHRSFLEDSAQEISALKTEKEELGKKVQQLENEIRNLKVSKCAIPSSAVCEDFDIINDEEIASAIVLQSQDNEAPSKEDLLLRNSLSETKLNQVSKELEEETFMVANLMQLLSEKENQISALREADTALEKEHGEKMSALNQELSAMSILLEETQKKCEKLEHELKDSENKLSEFQENVVKHEEKHQLILAELNEVYSDNQHMKKDLSLIQDNLSNVQNENTELKNALAFNNLVQIKQEEEVRRISKTTEQENLMKSDMMAAKLLNLELQLESEKERTEQLVNKLLTNTTESDTIEFLKVQTEEFKSDFLREKEVRMCAQQEAEQLRERVKLLEAELEGRSPRHGEHRRHHRRESRNGSSSDHSSEMDLICPKCMFAFTSDKAFQNHLDRCLN